MNSAYRRKPALPSLIFPALILLTVLSLASCGETRLYLPASVAEGEGTLEDAGTIIYPCRTKDTAVTFASSDPRIEVPAAIRIPSGSRETHFPITILDNSKLDTVSIVSILVDTDGYGVATASMRIIDDEAPGGPE